MCSKLFKKFNLFYMKMLTAEYSKRHKELNFQVFFGEMCLNLIF